MPTTCLCLLLVSEAWCVFSRAVFLGSGVRDRLRLLEATEASRASLVELGGACDSVLLLPLTLVGLWGSEGGLAECCEQRMPQTSIYSDNDTAGSSKKLPTP